MLKDWVAGGNCASWPRKKKKKGGKRSRNQNPFFWADYSWMVIGPTLIMLIIILIVNGGFIFDSKISLISLREPPPKLSN